MLRPLNFFSMMIIVFNNDEHKEIMEAEAAKDEVIDEQ